MYDAGGNKLRKTVVQSGSTVYTQDYVGGIEYRNGVLESIFHAEGRITNVNSTLKYEYVLKDHLGNTRIMFCDKNGDGLVVASSTQENSEITQENHYYPFGLAMEGKWLNTPSVSDNKYTFNGKELNSDFGLEWNDYGARFYDAAICRWVKMDRMSVAFADESPYSYAGNSPMVNIDIAGDFRVPASWKIDYPHFVAYLDKNISEILSSKKIMDNLLRYSGGKLTKSEVEKDIMNGKGPELVTGNRDVNDGRGGVLFADGQFDAAGRSEIFLSDKLLGEFEKAMKNPKVDFSVKQAILLNVVATLLHEYVHYGDRDDDYAEDNQGNRRPSLHEDDFEEGRHFSESVYGFGTGRIPGFPGAGFDLQGALLFINKQSDDDKGKKENEKEIPTPPIASRN